MSINILKYYFVEGYKNLFKNKRSTFASIVIMSFTLLLFGIFLIFAKHLTKFVNTFEEGEHIEVYIETDAKDSEVKELEKQIQNIEVDGVRVVLNTRYKSKEQAEATMKKMLEEKGSVLRNFENQPKFLPASFLLKITDIKLAPKVKAQIESMQNVSSVRHDLESTETLSKIMEITRIISYVIIVVLIISSILIISNTIKLTVFARRKEISIMKYVGATDDFIRGPFVVESLLIGIISAVIPLIILGAVYKPFQEIVYNLNRDLGNTGASINIFSYSSLLPDLTLSFLLIGIGIAISGNIISMRKYLDA